MSTSAPIFKPSQSTTPTASMRAMVAVSKIAGVSLKTPLDEVQLTQRGIAPVALDSLKQLGVATADLQWIIKPRTLAHRKNKSESLTPAETGRWLRAAKVQALAQEVFVDQNKALKWLHKTRAIFGGQSAIVIMQSEAGAQLVEDTLNQIDAGYFA
jgi:putative toxin-antitoxin system antitoxin component (TIGR02293 family)